MAKIDVSRTELVWPGKYDENGNLRETERVSLPFQVIETINEGRATREAAKKPRQPSLFDVYKGDEGETFEEGWKNKLIWGENKLVASSLLEKFAGKIELIYIDPPFATGADFSFTSQIGDAEVQVYKEQSILEEKAYRDTWGKYGPGRELDSYLEMMFERLVLAKELLSLAGVIVVHIGDQVASYVRSLMDDVFGPQNYRNTIIIRRGIKNVQAQFSEISSLAVGHDLLLLYTKSEGTRLPRLQHELAEMAAGKWDTFWRGTDRPTMRYELFGQTPSHGQWRWQESRARGAIANFEEFQKSHAHSMTLDEYYLKVLEEDGRDLDFVRLGPDSVAQYYVPPRGYKLISTVWLDVMTKGTITGYATEKHEELLGRTIGWLSSDGNLVADFFCGSGTTMAVAEKLGRRWIGCDLSRWAIHVSRKRLLGIEACKPFEVLNLGKYERKYWQAVTFGDKGKTDQELAIYQYIAFILRLYGAEPLTGTQHLHGKKGKAVVHIGAVDAPVTIDEINACLDECLALKLTELHVLGWEWEMGLNDLMVNEAKTRGVKLLLLTIPREVMEQQAVEKGDIQFFELAYLKADIRVDGRTLIVALEDFVIPNTELIPDDVRTKIAKWSDYIDYWAVDWDFQNDTFMNGWVAYRTRKNRKLTLTSDPHTYDKSGKYAVMVKVIDIFGNDTTQAFEVEVS